MKNLKIKTDTIVRTAVLALALINQILVTTGRSVIPVSDEQVTEMITLVLTVGSALWAWWKNNSFTKEAIAADDYMNDLKQGNSSEEEDSNELG